MVEDTIILQVTQNTKMTSEEIKARLFQLEGYLNKNWAGLADSFVERISARGEYDRLLEELKQNEKHI